MNIAEKIVHLRTNANLSQEDLANIIKVTRQSVSKWEKNESYPQVDKIMDICKLFRISPNDLLDNEKIINLNTPKEINKPKTKNKYFGTDGFRGESNKSLTAEGDESVVGNSSELKNAILMRHAQVPHYNYVGDSILGNSAHMGAGSILSNLRSDNKSVVIHADIDINTGIRKIGSFLGDHADIGCGAVLNPGTIIGQNTQVYPLTMGRGVYERDLIVKSTKSLVKKRSV